ncbi:MlaD family protein [Pollutimonas bauzanensis]|uniref:Phospholipid/cholesterol/gamma-HCH transport system substrate-binding protein n=1 Tax=Pollutimonas bauzanensis TaxID=658167 RepID=A0A1M5ZYQ4_9BURK|nr:MlaD family protein [Pollutimonas bauzanensis]SHI29370.1 phospholipid/cholesterol/gamma-HCH transport system substrate-binding protein [Pollutimonas bauzanensis]
MEPRAHHVLIGLFTIIVTAAAMLFALWLAKSHNDVEQRHYTVVFNEAVRGLSQGSAVQYSGIKIGDVVQLSLDPRNPNKVLARIRIEGKIPVKENTRARLVLTGITGVSVIELSGGTPESPPLLAADDADPIIVATPSPIAQLLANSDNLMANITELLLNANMFMSPDNARRLSNTLEHLEQLSGSLADQRGDMKTLLQSLTTASQEAGAALRRADGLMRNADTLLGQQGAGTLDGARRAMASLEKTSSSLNQLLDENKAALGRGMRGLGELGPALQELRSTLASLRTVARRLADNPTNYLLGREKIQEFQP